MATAIYEGRAVFAENLNAPYGLALAGNALYVANQDALVRFDYRPGQIRASGAPVEVTKLPSEINHHWTKALTASPDGRYLYVGIGSNSNAGERGMSVEEDRAMVWEVDAADRACTGLMRPGLRNPTALAVRPGLGQLWAVVNERDELGANLVPDYLTSVRQGAFYGWPYSYWGQNVDPRVRPQKPDKVAAAIRPDYSLGSHTAPLGLAFSSGAMGQRFADGAFVGMHGSWNRKDAVRLQGRVRAVSRRATGRAADRFRHRLHGRGRQDSRAAGRRDRRPARRTDRRGRSVKHHLAHCARTACSGPPGAAGGQAAGAASR